MFKLKISTANKYRLVGSWRTILLAWNCTLVALGKKSSRVLRAHQQINRSDLDDLE